MAGKRVLGCEMSEEPTEKQVGDKVNELLNGAELLRLVLLVQAEETKGRE